MSIQTSFTTILNTHTLPVPRRIIDKVQLEAWAGPLSGETSSDWLVAVKHETHAPASAADLSATEKALAQTIEGNPLPADYRTFLEVSNGANLFVVNAVWKQQAGATHPRFQWFGTERLVAVNRELFTYFRDSLGDTPRFADTTQLNFVAIGEAHNYNHVAIITAGDDAGKVFLLATEGMARPYAERYAEMYPTLAPSFAAWLELIATSNGWEGYGEEILFE
jgi:hypothetical protein